MNRIPTRRKPDGEPSNDPVVEQATAWIARLDSENCTDDDLAAMGAWLAADNAHQFAFARCSALWTKADELKVLRSTVGRVDEDILSPSPSRGLGAKTVSWLLALHRRRTLQISSK